MLCIVLRLLCWLQNDSARDAHASRVCVRAFVKVRTNFRVHAVEVVKLKSGFDKLSKMHRLTKSLTACFALCSSLKLILPLFTVKSQELCCLNRTCVNTLCFVHWSWIWFQCCSVYHVTHRVPGCLVLSENLTKNI